MKIDPPFPTSTAKKTPASKPVKIDPPSPPPQTEGPRQQAQTEVPPPQAQTQAEGPPPQRIRRRIVESCEHCGADDVFVSHTRVLYHEDPGDPNSALVPFVVLRYRPPRNQPYVVERYWKCNVCCRTGKVTERVTID